VSGPSGLGFARPAPGGLGQPGAVRPRGILPSPRPGSSGSRLRPLQSLPFFVSRAPALGGSNMEAGRAARSTWARGLGTWERLGNGMGTAKSLRCKAIVGAFPCSHVPPARVMGEGSRACAPCSLSLGTWEQRDIPITTQWVSRSRRCSRPAAALGTVGTAAHSPLAGACPIKIGAGYAAQQLWTGGARRKFWARPALDLVQLGRIRRGGGNGGFLRVSEGGSSAVGRVPLEGSGQAADPARLSARRRKLSRLTFTQAGGTPPSAARLPSDTLAQSVVRISIELRLAPPRPVRSAGGALKGSIQIGPGLGEYPRGGGSPKLQGGPGHVNG
jgi:hypothetical protein